MEETNQTNQVNEPVEPTVTSAPQPTLPPVGNLALIGMVFSDPYRLGKYILEKPSWWLPFVISAILAASFTLVGQKQMLAMTQHKMEQQFAHQSAQLPADKQQAVIDMALKATKITAPIFALFGSMAFSAIGALILLFVCNLLMGGTAKFKYLFAGLFWVELISSLSVLIKLPMVIIRDTFDVPIGPAVLLPEGSEGFLYTLLSGLDLFAVWMAIAAGMTIAAIYNWSKGKGVTVVLLIYILLLLAMAGLSTLGSNGGIQIQAH